MSAIEMMDPKMDAGMVCNKSAKSPLTFQDAVNTGHIVLDRWTLSSVVEPKLVDSAVLTSKKFWDRAGSDYSWKVLYRTCLHKFYVKTLIFHDFFKKNPM